MDSRYAKIYRNKNPGIWDVKIDFLKLKEKAKEWVIQGYQRRALEFLVAQVKIVYPVFLEMLAQC